MIQLRWSGKRGDFTQCQQNVIEKRSVSSDVLRRMSVFNNQLDDPRV